MQDYLQNPKMRKAIDVNRYDDMGLTPLHHAARLGHADIVRATISAKSCRTVSSAKPLIASAASSLRVIDNVLVSIEQALIEGKADPLLRDKVPQT